MSKRFKILWAVLFASIIIYAMGVGGIALSLALGLFAWGLFSLAKSNPNDNSKGDDVFPGGTLGNVD